MKLTGYLVFTVLVFLQLAVSQELRQKNPKIEQIISEVSSAHLRTTVEKLVSFGTRHSLSDTVSESRGIGAARRWIKSVFDSLSRSRGGRLATEFHGVMVPASRRVPQPTRIVNVVAKLSPKDPSSASARRMIVVGAHYDSRASDPMDASGDAPGANDDGSGTAVVLELARVLSKYEFDATIIFIAFAGEEQGLLGAHGWSQLARDSGWTLEAMLNNDMVGNTVRTDGAAENSYVRLYAEALSPLDTGAALNVRNTLGLENDGPSRTLARYVKEVGERYVPGFTVRIIYRRDRFLRGGDHSPFHDRGFAAVRIVDALENYDRQHQNPRTEEGRRFGDLSEFMDFEYAARNAKVNASVLASLAWSPAPPEGAGLVTSGLGSSTVLRWNRNPEGDLAGYLVRYRETTSPVWQRALFTPDTTITLDVSKDDYLFGIQAVDREGNASLVVLPRPVR